MQRLVVCGLAAFVLTGLAACGSSVAPPSAATQARAAVGVLPASITQVKFADRADLQRLVSTYDALEKVDHETQQVWLLLADAEVQALRTAGYAVNVDVAATERLRAKALLASQPRPGFQAKGISGFECYRTVEETYADLEALQAARPDLVELRDIGDSWAKANPLPLNPYGAGYDILAARLTNSAIPGPKPVFFLYSATHARELPTAELTMRFAEQLVKGYGSDADATWLLDHTEIHVLPLGNPDARKYAEEGTYWRKNVNANHCPLPSPPGAGIAGGVAGQGVDLNRNMAFAWGGDLATEADGASSGMDCSGSYRGSGPNSEPENIAVADYMARVFTAVRSGPVTEPVSADTSGVFITVHNAASLNLFPWGYTVETPAPDFAALRSFGRKLSFFNGYTTCWDCLYASNGTHDDYAYAEFGAMAFTIELTDGDFFEPCDSFEATTAPKNLEALRYTARASWRPYTQGQGPDSTQLSVTPAQVKAGVPVVLTAQVDDARYAGVTSAEQEAGDVEPVQAIAAVRYTLGAPGWVEGRSAQPMLAADLNYDSPSELAQATVNTTGLAPGRHLLVVEAQDADGHWGAPSAVFFEVLP